mgnify:CR=1 FL=1
MRKSPLNIYPSPQDFTSSYQENTMSAHCVSILIILVIVLMHAQGVDGRRRKMNATTSPEGGEDSGTTKSLNDHQLDFPQTQDPRLKIMFWRPQKVGSVCCNISLSDSLSHFVHDIYIYILCNSFNCCIEHPCECPQHLQFSSWFVCVPQRVQELILLFPWQM